ncbi:fatty acyl-CoA reductase wat-like [Anopheles nili]|uniref:fatty acyl-CoA reductase wat-like n=1 Tax=Anopheles nili TaxID=185578 RepID=UPI00237BF233|nr:fatty acyl-CoA reductase wat-like [Anopheles nili]
MIRDPIFETIRESMPHPDKVLAKLVAIEADFTSDEFVKEPFKTDLFNETEVVFHVMAQVRFDMGIQQAIDANVTAMERLFNFIRAAPRLQSIVHVSTLYSNCDRSHIEECVYDDLRFGGLENIRRILAPLTEAEKEKLNSTILGPMPNSYVFSKKCAEVTIKHNFSELPIGIFRPPIVTPSCREPEPGWVGCFQGATGLTVPILKHQLLWYYGDRSARAALAPVDYCIGGMITAACDIRARYEEARVLESFDRKVPPVPVYNFYFEKNTILWVDYIAFIGSGLPTAMGRKLSPVRMQITQWRIISRITFWLLYLAAYIADFLLVLLRKPRRNVRNVSLIDWLADTVEYFRCNTWTAQNDNTKRMRLLLAKADEPLLEFDADRIDLQEYYQHCTKGLLKELERRELRRRQKTNNDVEKNGRPTEVSRQEAATAAAALRSVHLQNGHGSSNMSDTCGSKVIEFYQDSVVLITGASGFLGKVLLEKLLRCLDARKIYVLIRRKRDYSAQMRLEQILKSMLFDRVRTETKAAKGLFDRIEAVEVNFERNDLGLEPALRDRLRHEVEIAFNLLASVNFNEALDQALETNVECTRRVLCLLGGARRLKSVIHVSTFYSNCNRTLIEEKIYDDIGFGGYDNIKSTFAKLQDDHKQFLSPVVLGTFPNSYTFSKKCAEVVVQDKFGHLPIGIFRPPIVTSSYREPVPGWVDNFNGPSGMVVPLSQGLYSAALLDPKKKPFIVPVDFCVNALLVCAHDVSKANHTKSIPVYNYTDDCNLWTWDQVINGFFSGLGPIRKLVAKYFTGTITVNPVRYAICKRIMMFQAFCLDLIRTFTGKEKIMQRLFSKMVTLSEVLRFFCLNDWKMTNANIRRISDEMSPLEAEMFPLDIRKIDWTEYYRNFVPGVIKYAVQPRSPRSPSISERKLKDSKLRETKKLNSGLFYLLWSSVFIIALKIFKNLFNKV